jgi:hypothetical protein
MNFQVFAKKQPIRNGQARAMSDILDGTANTLMFAESLQRCGGQGTIWSHGDWNVQWMPIFGGGKKNDNKGTAITTGLASVPQTIAKKSGCNPNRTTASGHPAGVVVTLCDASVTLINEDIDPQTWWNLVRRDDGEAVGNFN